MTDLTNLADATWRTEGTSGLLTTLTADLKMAADPEFGDNSHTRRLALQIRDEILRGL